jgi:hypothetical protein
MVFKIFRGYNNFIMQKVYLLLLMPVCVGLIMLAAYFCHSCSLQVESNLGLELSMRVLKNQIHLVRQSL